MEADGPSMKRTCLAYLHAVHRCVREEADATVPPRERDLESAEVISEAVGIVSTYPAVEPTAADFAP